MQGSLGPRPIGILMLLQDRIQLATPTKKKSSSEKQVREGFLPLQVPGHPV